MTQAAHIEHLAPVIDLHAWRVERLSPTERVTLDARRARPAAPHPHGWRALGMVNMSDARDGAAMIARLGGHPIAVYGATGGVCMCAAGAGCDKPGKHPVGNGWQSAGLDLAALDDLLRRRPGLNLGWRMGRQPNGWNLIAVDVDGDRSLLAAVEAKHGALPPTLTATSARGLHLIYRVPVDRIVGNRVALARGVDVRGTGGQIVVSPSRHASGAQYQWVDAREPAVLT